MHIPNENTSDLYVLCTTFFCLELSALNNIGDIYNSVPRILCCITPSVVMILASPKSQIL